MDPVRIDAQLRAVGSDAPVSRRTEVQMAAKTRLEPHLGILGIGIAVVVNVFFVIVFF